METIHEYLSNIIYINLDHRKDRNEQFLSQMNKIGLYDGKNTNIKRLSATHVYPQGWIGCTKSHIRALECAIENNFPYVVIMEDDFIWKPNSTLINLIDRLNSIKKSFHNKWNVIMLAGYICKVDDIDVNICDDINIKKIVGCQTTSGYIVSNNYYQTLLNNFKDALVVQEKFIPTMHEYYYVHGGYALDQYWKSLQVKDFWLLINPPLGMQSNGFSDVINRNTVNYV